MPGDLSSKLYSRVRRANFETPVRVFRQRYGKTRIRNGFFFFLYSLTANEICFSAAPEFGETVTKVEGNVVRGQVF